MLNLSHITVVLIFMGSLTYYETHMNQTIDAILLSDANSTVELTLEPLKSKADSLASGTFAPKGRPIKPPARVEAGKHCIVDLVQTYVVSGTLSGTFEINYRILVYGPCGEAPGTYEEEWIAYGALNGKMSESPAVGKFSYTAKSRADGEVDGHMVFNQGINGELEIKGNFNDGKLSYAGWLTK